LNEHHLDVTRRARYFTLGADSTAPREIWIACHGYGQLASRFLRQLEPLDDGTRLVAAPEGLSRFYLDPIGVPRSAESRVGASWMTREDRDQEITDYVHYLDVLATQLLTGRDRSAVRVIAFGFSQGVSTVVRWAALGTVPVDQLILWAGSLPEDLVLAHHRPRFGTSPVIVAVGDADEFLNQAAVERQRGRLRDAGIRATFVPFTGGHVVDATVLARIAMSGARGQ